MGDNLIETDNSADLWQRLAFAYTVFLASQHGMPLTPDNDLGLHHLMQMRIHAQNMEGSKLGRWLGWAQCAVVSAGVGLTLDDMKAINQRCMTEGADVHMTQSGALTVNEVPTGALALSPEGDIGAIRKIQPVQGFGYWSYTGNAYPDGAPIADDWRVV